MYALDNTQLTASGLLIPRFRPVIDNLTINRSHLAQGLQLYTLYTGAHAGYDLAGQELLTVGAGIIEGINEKGPFVKGTSYTDTTSHITTRDFPVADWDGLTVASFLQTNHVGSGYPGVISCVNSGSYAGKFHLSMASASFIFRAGNSGTSTTISHPGVSSTEMVFVCGTWDKSTIRLYSDYNGSTYTPELTMSSVAQSTNAVASTPENYIGYISRGGGRAFTAPIFLSAVWDHELPAVEVKAFYDDPLSVANPLRPDIRLVTEPAAAAALSRRYYDQFLGERG